MSRQVQSGTTIVDSFPGIDYDGFTRVTGLSAFTTWVWRDGVVDSSVVTITEIGTTGEYKIELDAGASGLLKVQILVDYNKDLFEWNFDIREYTEDDLNTELAALQVRVDDLTEIVGRVLGLSQENIFIDSTTYDPNSQLLTSRVRIFDTKAHCEAATDGGSETEGLLATYTQTTNWETINQFQTYRQVKE